MDVLIHGPRGFAAAVMVAAFLSPATAPASTTVPLQVIDGDYDVATCLEQAAILHGVSPRLLRAIAYVESRFDPQAIHHNQDGSRDLGIMQINSRWLAALRRHGIGEHDLFRPCVNISVGAWVLANNFARLGPRWEAVGAYNARSRDKRLRYVRRVMEALLTAP